MGKDKSKVQSILESLFANAVGKLSKANDGRLIGEMHVQIDSTLGEIQVYDDQEVLLEKNVIFDWTERPEKSVRPHKPPTQSIRAALVELKLRKIFDSPVFMRPLAILLVDDNFDEIETIFTLEEADGVSEGRLMKNLEQELKEFSRKLFADVE